MKKETKLTDIVPEGNRIILIIGIMLLLILIFSEAVVPKVLNDCQIINPLFHKCYNNNVIWRWVKMKK